MKTSLITAHKSLVPVLINVDEVRWLVIGGGKLAYDKIRSLITHANNSSITVIAPEIIAEIKSLGTEYKLTLIERQYEASDFSGMHMLIAATDNLVINQRIKSEASVRNILVDVADAPQFSDFYISDQEPEPELPANDTTAIKGNRFLRNGKKGWEKLASRLIIAFALMVIGHLLISYLPLPSTEEIWTNIKPYFNTSFLLFVLTGFIAQMVDGLLSMGYGVTSATCLISMGVSPVSVSAAIHTSEVFTSGISGYSHYRFGNVNKKLFKHLVIPGVIGAILGALLLVFLGEAGGKWLMPVMAMYALFLGVKILVKAFQIKPKSTKLKRVGWLAWVGGFLDSFGGGGWGPIVTSTLISKGRSPKYTIGSVSLTEFFVTLASAFTFFVTAGISHWNVVLGLLIGGAIAAPFAARLAGKLPKKTMMIAVGIMVIIWCIRIIIKGFS